MKRILFLFLPFLPYLASAQVAKDTVTVLTLAQIPAGAIRDTTNLTFVQDNAFNKARFDSLARYVTSKLIGDRGDITVSGATGLTWELDAGVVDSMQLSAGAVVLPGAKVTGTLPVSKGGTGSQTQNFVDLTTSQTVGGAKTFSNQIQAPSFRPTGSTIPANGMYLPSAEVVAFATNFEKRMEINTSGQIGMPSVIGTAQLTVNGNIGFAGTSTNSLFYFPETGSHTGSLGFQAGFGSPAAGGGYVMYGHGHATKPGWTTAAISEASGTTGTTTEGRFTVNNSGRGTGTDVFTVLRTGNVGIGVTAPASKLQVDGAGAFANGTAALPTVTNTGNTDTGMWFPAADVVGFSTGGVERMRVKANGQVRFIPLAADPAGAENGDVYYNSATNKLRVYANGTWVDLH